MERDEYLSSLNTSMLINKEWQYKYEKLAKELEEAKKSLFEAVEDNQ